MIKLLFLITSKSLLLFEQADDCLQEAVKKYLSRSLVGMYHSFVVTLGT